MGKIKILHIIKSLGRGGAEMLLPETLKLHNQDKFDFHYIYFLPWKDQMVISIKEAGGKVTCFDARDNVRLMLKYNEIISYCKTHKIDLIHCHLPWAGFVGRLVHKRTKIPVIYTEHNMQERYHIATKTINKLTFNSQSLALGVSRDVTESIQKNIRPKISVETLLNGVNTKTFRKTGISEIRKELGIPENAIVIGNVAVFRFQKRLLEWLQVIKNVHRNNPNIYGLIVGAGPLEEEIKAEWKKKGLEKIVFFSGLQTNVKPYFEAMDIFMMTSSFEGLPIALLEAMSMECAIVSTDAGGIKEVIRDESDGLICPVNKWEKLEKYVQRLIVSPEKMNNLKKAARNRVVKKFSLEKMVVELERYYTEISSN
ncbi:glycosyltransferase [Salegentibacter agarivorans]